ncbi:MAG: hypothetical protein J5621_01640 [Paludibacteraceae bacterium]|nr:hypothetical protein [Paludibacteraceae bacterium]
MKIKLKILLLLTLFAINMSAQEIPKTANRFGNRVIQDYLSFCENLQKARPKYYPTMHLWFEDYDTRQMAAGFINSHADLINADTIFFIESHNSLYIVPGDTLFWLLERRLEGDARFLEAYKTPFLNVYSKIYWEDLCTWDTAHISAQPSIEDVVCGGSHYYVVRLIYHNGLLTSAEFCHHDDKSKYGTLYDWGKDISIPYPEGKMWPLVVERKKVPEIKL